jgi:hypothetical protein
MKKSTVLPIVLLAAACAAPLEARIPEKTLMNAYASISPCGVYELDKTISSARFAGRLTGEDGYTAAAHWAAGKFKEWGLKPVDPTQGYLQAFPSPYTIVDAGEMTFILTDSPDSAGAPIQVKLELAEDFLPTLYTDSGDHTAGLVFAGWGISAPELSYDDYAGLDVAGKYVLCFRGTPDDKNKAYQDCDQHRHRMKTARDKGALGIIYIYPEVNAHPNSDWMQGFTAAMISDKISDTLFAEKGSSSARLRETLAKTKKPDSFALDARVHYTVSSRHFPNGVGYNIVGMIPGSDPKLKGEYVVVGGHFDHCGLHMGLLFAGADDNASGSAVTMEIAETAAKLKERPARSIVFVLFGGEEEGLVGSTYFSAHTPAPIAKIDAMFNFDMTGEGEGTNCGYTTDPQEFKKTIDSADTTVKTLRRSWPMKDVGVRSSDFAPFFLKGAPCAAFFSNGPHVSYHQTGDTIYRINPDMLADISKIGFLSAVRWADR